MCSCLGRKDKEIDGKHKFGALFVELPITLLKSLGMNEWYLDFN